MYRIFGIRHHGPGSARRLRRALAEWQPDCLLIEGPPDAQSELKHLHHAGLEPPLALLVYNEADLRQAVYYPFARFSPEWQALRWATEHDLPVSFIDLPVAHGLALPKPTTSLLPTKEGDDSIATDPLTTAAHLAGFEDTELWWEHTFEQEAEDLAVFDAVLELMTALRQEFPLATTSHTLLREAHMRQAIRKALRQSFQRIAVVCGAWHAPALATTTEMKVGPDQQRLKGLPKVKVKAAWTPWSYPRLAKMSGYGAGITSPAWYEMVFDHGPAAVGYWMVRVAMLLREEGLDASPAHAQEAVRLAHTLAALRRQRLPGLQALSEAALSCLCQGEEERLQLVEAKLIQGDKVGAVPTQLANVPLLNDFYQQLKTTRLKDYWGTVGKQYLKAKSNHPRGGIDLRTASDLQKSHLLHRLDLLAVGWAYHEAANVTDLGSFKEIWRLNWEPECHLRLLEAAMWGSTVAEAAAARLRHLADKAGLTELVALIQKGLQADLAEQVGPLIQALHDQAGLTHDLPALLGSVPGLIGIIQYGDTRHTDTTSLALLLTAMLPRIIVGLPGALSGIADEPAAELLKLTLAAHHALALLQIDELSRQWMDGLARIASLEAVHPLPRGAATRLLFDRDQLTYEQLTTRFSYALSPTHDTSHVVAWLEGFLHGSALLLLHHQALWGLLDQWIAGLEPEVFQSVLPLLRRTFSRFSPGERGRMLQLALHPPIEEQAAGLAEEPVFAENRRDIILAGIDQWTVDGLG